MSLRDWCPTCGGPGRETVGTVCQTCGTDYYRSPELDMRARIEALAVLWEQSSNRTFQAAAEALRAALADPRATS